MFDKTGTPLPEYPFNARHLTLDGHRIYCVECGSGDPILFVHGNPTSSYVWRDVMPRVAQATGRRCIAIDLLGMGRSDKPRRVKLSLQLHRDIIAGAVAELGLNNIVLVAEDWGGPLAMHHAVHQPDLYQAAILMESFLWTFSFDEDFHPKFRMPFRMMRGPLGFVFVQMLNLMTKKLIPEHCPITEDGMQYYLDSTPTVASRRAILEFVRLNPLHGSPQASVDFIQQIQNRLAQSNLPITWLMPSPGVIVSSDYPPSQSKFAKFKQRFPNVRERPFGPGHHYLSEENPILVARHVSEVLGEMGLTAAAEEPSHVSVNSST